MKCHACGHDSKPKQSAEAAVQTGTVKPVHYTRVLCSHCGASLRLISTEGNILWEQKRTPTRKD